MNRHDAGAILDVLHVKEPILSNRRQECTWRGECESCFAGDMDSWRRLGRLWKVSDSLWLLHGIINGLLDLDSVHGRSMEATLSLPQKYDIHLSQQLTKCP
jgi:hypothetical protein